VPTPPRVDLSPVRDAIQQVSPVPLPAVPSTPGTPGTPAAQPPAASPAVGGGSADSGSAGTTGSRGTTGTPRTATRTAAGGRTATRRARARRGRRRRAARRATPAQRAARPVARGRAKTAPRPADSRLRALGESLGRLLPVPDWSKPIIVLLALVAAGLAVRSLIAARRVRRLVGDLGVMQAALVPELPATLGELQVSVAYRPADGPAAGGDFYEVVPLADDRVAIMLGDVSGHGGDALARAALTRYTLRAYVQAGLEPRQAIRLAGDVLSGEDSDDFATVVIGVHDAAAGTLTYATAGHPPPLVVGAGAHEPVTPCSSPPIGLGLPTGRRQTTIPLSGGLACFFSDGLTDARVDGEVLGRVRVSEIFAALGAEPDAPGLLAGVRAAADDVPDDMAACIVKPRREPAQPVVRVEELELEAGAVSGDRGERFLTACDVPADAIPAAMERASELAAEGRSVLLDVAFGEAGPTVEVAAAAEGNERPQLSAALGDPAVPA
jgi:hypothetical protein